LQDFAAKSLDLFREHVDLAVENTVPERSNFITKLQDIARLNTVFILDEKDNSTGYIIELPIVTAV